MKSNEKIIADANALARLFYARLGYQVPEGFAFHAARHPQEQMCWEMACDAYEEIEGTDVRDVLRTEIDEALDEAAHVDGAE